MKIKNYAISFTMIALLVLMQFASPFLHAHTSEYGQGSSYAMHFHGDTGHDEDTTKINDVVHFEAIASYISSYNPVLTKTILFKKSEPIALVQSDFSLIADSAESFPPPIIFRSSPPPVSIGFMALAPPVV